VVLINAHFNFAVILVFFIVIAIVAVCGLGWRVVTQAIMHTRRC
jgi:hypothetical protein